MLAWFLVFTVVATFMYGALFVAAGAAVTNAKEAQSLIAPIMLFIALPMYVLIPTLQDPSGRRDCGDRVQRHRPASVILAAHRHGIL